MACYWVFATGFTVHADSKIQAMRIFNMHRPKNLVHGKHQTFRLVEGCTGGGTCTHKTGMGDAHLLNPTLKGFHQLDAETRAAQQRMLERLHVD